MESRLNFGITELIAGVLGVGSYFLFSVLQYNLYLKGFVVFISYIYMPGILVTLMSAIFGPAVGLTVGIGGQLLDNVYIYGDFGGIDLLVIIVVSISIGMLKKRLNVLEGKMDIVGLIDFNAINIFVSLITLVFVRPFVSFLMSGDDFAIALQGGIKVAVGGILTTIILGTPILWGVNRVMQKLYVIITLRRYNRG